MIRIINGSYLENHWKRYPDTEGTLRDWLNKIQYSSCKSLSDFIQDSPKTVRVSENVLSFQITPAIFLLASFDACLKTLTILGIGTLYSAFVSSNLDHQTD
ncbi:MAG: hypothetical protein EBT45_04935 [Alphaproteobacteria bacterium]|jgi:mRNA-degrading endonuclease HigB of HigAB toxin-antitoxin module|nr:hypothetical protein [Alphaproteobacteria bacterium]